MVYDMTEDVKEVLKKSGVKQGLCHIFVPATTCGLMLNENERALLADFAQLFSFVPEVGWSHPDNAHSHLRANMVKQEASIPIENGELVLGQWQSILLWEFDVHPRKREVVVTVSGV
jgi:secondary thiamine-phosphate synthase enzyme